MKSKKNLEEANGLNYDNFGFSQAFGLQDLSNIASENKNLSGEELIEQMNEDEGKAELQKRLVERQKDGRGRPKKEGSDNNIRMTFIVDKELLDKFRFITYKKRMFMKEVIYEAMQEYVKRYERDNGVIEDR